MEWKLKDLTVDGKGSYGIGAPAVPYQEDKLTYLRITDINDDGSLNFSDLKSVDAEDAEKYILKENDIVFARTGNSTGRSYFYEKQHGTFVYAGFLIKFSFDPNKVNPRILKYYTHSKPYFDWVNSFDTGATRGNINAKTYGDMEIELPSRKVQDKIVSILSSLDRKIELNNKINADLEEMAQAIFKNWFVDFEPFKDGKFVDSELGMIPEGWKVGTLEEIAEITMGQSPAGNSLNENREGMIFYQGSSDFGFRFPSIRVFTTEPKRLAVANSVLFSVRAPVGDINVAKEECCIGRGVASIKSKYGHDSYLFYTMKSLHKLFDSFDGEGTVFGSINKKTLSAIQILLPSDGIVEQFNNIASSFDDRIRSLSDENSRLSLLRDTLLPRLMSGEIEVPE